MASSREFHDYIVEQLRYAGEVTTRKMMGEYCVYYRGKVIGLMCDNTLLLKPVPTVLQLLAGAERMYPYEGSRTLMVAVEDVENTPLMAQVLEALDEELPEPKKR